jgi:hypothetical protein
VLVTDRHTAGRHLRWPSCVNVRDLGGLPALGGVTRFGAFVRSDSVVNLNAQGRRAMRAHGVRTVVDLRWPRELADDPNPFAAGGDGVAYHSFPLFSPRISDADISKYSRWTLHDVYAMAVEDCAPTFAAIFEAFAAAPDGGILFHCWGGKDRTGLIAALLLSLSGVDDEVIVEDYRLSHANLRPVYEGVLSAVEDAERRFQLERQFDCPPEALGAVLAAVRHQFGGAREYLIGGGAAGNALDAVAARLTA